MCRKMIVWAARWWLLVAAASPGEASTAACMSPNAEPVFTKVFAGKEAGYAYIRIPLVLQTDKGTLLAFAEGRRGTHDQSSNDTIHETQHRRRRRPGRTCKTIADDGDNCLNLGCVVQDRRTGRIFVFGGIIPAGHESMEFRYLSPGMQNYQRQAGAREPAGDQARLRRPGHLPDLLRLER